MKGEKPVSNSIIVLNSRYEYWDEVPVKKFLNWMSNNKIEVILEQEDNFITGVDIKIKMPMVIRLLGFFGYKAKSDNTKNFNKYKMFERDAYICQYWHFDEFNNKFKYKCSVSEATVDHVIPQDQKGETSYENCVCCCDKHNNMKANRTPKEAGLKLIRKPVSPIEMKKGEYVRFHFSFNPDKPSHRAFMEFYGKN